MINYELSQSDLRYVQRKLKENKEKAPRVIKNAVNHTAKQARKELAEGAQAAYAVKSGGLNSRVKIQNATTRRLYAVIRVKGRTLTIGRFHTTTPKKGAKADIVKKGLKELKRPLSEKKEKGEDAGREKYASAFKRKGLIMQRKTGERYPLKVLRAVSAPKMFEKVYEGEKGVKGALSPVIKKTLHSEIRKEIKKII